MHKLSIRDSLMKSLIFILNLRDKYILRQKTSSQHISIGLRYKMITGSFKMLLDPFGNITHKMIKEILFFLSILVNSMILPFHHSIIAWLLQETMELFAFGTMVIEKSFIAENLLQRARPHQ